MISKIAEKLVELNDLITEETGMLKPILKLGVSYEFFNYFGYYLSQENNRYLHATQPVDFHNLKIANVQIKPVKEEIF